VIVAGCFDRLHNGHKALLTTSVCVCAQHLTVVVCGEARGRVGEEKVEEFKVRRYRVQKFLGDIVKDRNIVIKVVRGHKDFDVFCDEKLEVMVISDKSRERDEVLINGARNKKNLGVLEMMSVGVVRNQLDEALSSSVLRI